MGYEPVAVYYVAEEGSTSFIFAFSFALLVGHV